MPTEIQTPTAWLRLATAFRLTGRHKLLLDEVVVPVVVIEDLSLKLAERPVDATFVMFAPGTVALPLSLLLENSSEGSVFLVDAITASVAADSTLQATLTTTAPVAPVAAGAADKTWNDNLQTPIVPGTMFADTGTFVGPDFWKGRILFGNPFTFKPKIVLRPGQMLAFTNSTANVQMRIVINVRVVPFDEQ